MAYWKEDLFALNRDEGSYPDDDGDSAEDDKEPLVPEEEWKDDGLDEEYGNDKAESEEEEEEM